MYEKNTERIFNIFCQRIVERSKEYGMGRAYIKGQVKEARHQLDLQSKKVIKGFSL